MLLALCAIMLPNAPINAKPARGGGGRLMWGMVWGFDIIQKFVVKFAAHGQIVLIS